MRTVLYKIFSPSVYSKSNLAAGNKEFSENEKQNEYGNKDCTAEMDRMSVRLNLMEQQIHLLHSKNKHQENDIHLMNEKINRLLNTHERKTREKRGLNKQESSNNRESFWSKLQIPFLDLGSMPYEDYGINIYGHSENTFKADNEKQYFYAPISQLLHKSAAASFNNISKQHEVIFPIQMWDEELEEKLRKYTEKLVKHPLEKERIRVLPLEKVKLSNSKHQSGAYYQIKDHWMDYNRDQILPFKFICKRFDDCNRLSDEIKSNPQQMNDLRLEFTVKSQGETSQQEITLRMGNILTDGSLAMKLIERYPGKEQVFLIAEDEKQLLAELKGKIIVAPVIEDSAINLDPELDEYVDGVIKNVLIESRGKITFYHDSKMWESLFWKEEDYRPDNVATSLNEIYKIVDNISMDELSNCFKNDSKVAICNLNSYFLGNISKTNNYSEEAVDKLMKESQGNIIWTGKEFIPTPKQVAKINLEKLRNKNSFPDKTTMISFTNASLLSTGVHIQPNYKEKDSNLILQLKNSLQDLQVKIDSSILKKIKDGDKEDVEGSRGFSLARSCFELKATNPSAQSGVYDIDPDGQIGHDPPIKVYCDMATRTTSIYHDTEAKTNITACVDPGFYTKAIHYNATMRQLTMLADVSASCKQHIRFVSTGVPLEYNNTQYGYWNDRNGGKQIFWAGPATNQHTCQCGIMNNCIEKSYTCNADSLAPIELFDEGFITATDLLPVTRLSFGRTSLTGVKASYTLGRFECTGQATISSKPTNCRDLFKMGHTLSGFYDVKNSSTQIASTYCDFSKSSSEAGYETRYGFVDVKSSPVHFFVVRTSSWNKVGTMPFEKQYLNLGGGMNLTSGIFTAPKTGIYAFSFKGLAYGSDSDYAGRGGVNLQRNGADFARGFSQINGAISGTYSIVSVHGTLKLKKGDAITIRHGAGTIFSNSASDIQFTGSLLVEDLVIS